VRTRDEEIARMRAELETSQAELERLRRRLKPTRP
jgi:predicted RNase H-like nuclease (RuvC/YqgF family)